jgi:hypothetical protein
MGSGVHRSGFLPAFGASRQTEKSREAESLLLLGAIFAGLALIAFLTRDPHRLRRELERQNA